MKLEIFKDSVCLVTGASSGIGRSLSKKLIEHGAEVVVGANIRNVSIKDEKFIFKRLDVTDYERFKEVIDEIVDNYGRIDFIFNNAGIAVAGEAQDIPIEHWKKILEVNLNGVIYGSLIAYNYMIKQGFGCIVNISSIGGIFPLPLEAPYVVSKFGVLGLSLVMRVEGALKGVKVCAVCPGFIATPMFEKTPTYNIDLKKYGEIVANSLGKISTPDECAEVILNGVAEDKPIITVTEPAKWMWYLSRINPNEMIEIAIDEYSKILPLVKMFK